MALFDGSFQFMETMSILHRFRVINTCLAYVTARYLEQSFKWVTLSSVRVVFKSLPLVKRKRSCDFDHALS